ncbi:reverse transcriptase domain-containing protein [Tanacetum coccineum]
MEALTTRIDSQFKEIKRDMKEMRDGCNKCGGPHPSSDCDDKPMGGPKEEEANYASGGYRGGYRGNYYGRNYGNWRDPNDLVKNQFYNLKTKVEQGQKNQAAIQDLKTKFGTISDHQSSRPTGTLPSNTQTNLKPSTSNDKPYRPPPARNEHANVIFTRSGKTYDPPVNPNTKPVVFLDDSEDEADEVEKDAEPLPKKPTYADPLPLKAYKPKILYPIRLHKEKMEARYAKFLDMIKEVRINVPLVDVLASMPNYGKFLKDLVSNKSKMEQISVAFLTEESSAILQYKLPPKLRDPGSFLISCKLVNSVEYLALVNLGASINLMPYSLYTALSGTTLKPTRMSIRLANHTYQYPMGVVENMFIQVGKIMFPVNFVILQMEENDRVPLILGRPFLHTADHSHLNNDTCFRMDVINEVTEDELDALLDDSKPFLIVISALLEQNEKERLVSVLKNHKEAFAWKTFDIPGISPSFCKHKINFEDDVKPIIQRQRRLNPNMKEVVKKEIIKLLDAGIIYAIEDSPWVSPVHCVPKKE